MKHILALILAFTFSAAVAQPNYATRELVKSQIVKVIKQKEVYQRCTKDLEIILAFETCSKGEMVKLYEVFIELDNKIYKITQTFDVELDNPYYRSALLHTFRSGRQAVVMH